MDKSTIIKTLREMAKHPTVTLPRDCEALKAAADLIEQAQKQERTGSCPLEDCDGGPETHGCWAHNCEWKAQKQEPVAFPRNVQEYDEDWIVDPAFITRVKHSIDPETPFDFTPTMEQVEATLLALEVIPASLFTSPPQRQPLTDDEIWKDDGIMAANSGYGATFDTLREVVRAIETAHGITGEKE